MKKNITIGIAIVVVLIAAIGAISFATWDNTSASITIGTINTPDNVKLSVATDTNNSGKKLVPSGAVKTANEAETVSLGSFTLTLSSNNNADQATIAEKVKLSWDSINVTTGDVDISQYLQPLVLIKVEDGKGAISLDNDVNKNYNVIASTDELVAGTTYVLAMKFVDSYDNANAKEVSVVINRAITAVVNFNCVAR